MAPLIMLKSLSLGNEVEFFNLGRFDFIEDVVKPPIMVFFFLYIESRIKYGY